MAHQSQEEVDESYGEGFIAMGKKHDMKMEDTPEDEPEVYYPSLFIEDVGARAFPEDEEFRADVVLRTVGWRKGRNGSKGSVDLEVLAIKPAKGGKKDKPDGGESRSSKGLSDALSKLEESMMVPGETVEVEIGD